MGQHWGYIMGLYNESTGQIADCIKHVYPTDSGYYMGFGASSAPGGFNTPSPANPGGAGVIGGRSSGTKSWRD